MTRKEDAPLKQQAPVDFIGGIRSDCGRNEFYLSEHLGILLTKKSGGCGAPCAQPAECRRSHSRSSGTHTSASWPTPSPSLRSSTRAQRCARRSLCSATAPAHTMPTHEPMPCPPEGVLPIQLVQDSSDVCRAQLRFWVHVQERAILYIIPMV